MWGFGGRYYWGRRVGDREKAEGVVVVFAWMSSQERHLKSYVQLYGSLGWNSLVCHSQFLNMFFPDKAEALAVQVLSALIEEVKVRPFPVVFASFSGGPKACMYKIIQILEGQCETQLSPDNVRLVRDCMSGYIFDSGPTDFTSDLGARFVVHPSVLKMSRPPRLASWVANGIASGLDALFLSRFESQRAEYWQTLYSSIGVGAPYLILCSETDDLAPYQIISNFARRLQDLGADVKMITWSGSPHVGHYRHYPVDYKAAATELLGKAAAIYSQRHNRVEQEKMGFEGGRDVIPDPIFNLGKAATGLSQGSHGLTLALSDQFLVPTSVVSYDGGSRNFGSVQDNHQEDMIHLPARPSINAHGVLGQILFDVCVPKDVEDWDIKQSYYSNRRPFASSRRHAPFNPIKCILRSRL
ncbi:uncharacterized protein LOC116216055 [Punica granatum]|uniref:DUF829 domain-containing protein n=2 Tax=Punica granatum TaxID=22663 RepID=A0A218X7T3_PUNGR|nr:uncharacterized protein LOC116216055 [Punica granatum]OWM80739.1 hypothetical protein CDL15_Pgr006769 [Punica granatum]PKI50657.1 hypothetical protein CRG98_028969 [Punica granatum]